MLSAQFGRLWMRDRIVIGSQLGRCFPANAAAPFRAPSSNFKTHKPSSNNIQLKVLRNFTSSQITSTFQSIYIRQSFRTILSWRSSHLLSIYPPAYKRGWHFCELLQVTAISRVKIGKKTLETEKGNVNGFKGLSFAALNFVLSFYLCFLAI